MILNEYLLNEDDWKSINPNWIDVKTKDRHASLEKMRPESLIEAARDIAIKFKNGEHSRPWVAAYCACEWAERALKNQRWDLLAVVEPLPISDKAPDPSKPDRCLWDRIDFFNYAVMACKKRAATLDEATHRGSFH